MTQHAPQRVQLRRTKGWRKPANTIVVARPGRWGNPSDWTRYPRWSSPYLPDGELDDSPTRYSDAQLRRWAVRDFQAEVQYRIGATTYPDHDEIREHLAGRNLACWCPPGDPCHADVLLRIANDPVLANCAAAGHPPHGKPILGDLALCLCGRQIRVNTR